MATSNLGLTEMTVGQSQAEVTHNQALGELDFLLARSASQVVDDSNAHTVTAAQLLDNVGIILTDDSPTPTGLVTLTFPATSRGLYVVKNNMTENVLVEITSQSETGPTISAGEISLVHTDGVNVRGAGGGGGAGNFLALSDTPSSFTGQKGKLQIVNDAEDAVVFGPTFTAQLGSSSFKHSHKGALLALGSPFTIADNSTTRIPWSSATLDTGFSNDSGVTTQKFWLGPDLNLGTVTAGSDEAVATAHGMTTGDGPFRLSTTSSDLPSGLFIATSYWAIRVDDNTIQFATSRANALAGTQIDLVDAGTGTHTLERAEVLVVPEGVTKIKISGGIRWVGNGTGRRVVIPSKNFDFTGQPGLAHLADGDGLTTATYPQALVSSVLEVVAGDTFELAGFQLSTGNLDVQAVNTTFFEIQVIESDVTIPFPAIMVEGLSKGALAHMTTTQSIAAFTNVPLEWDVVDFDTGHDGSDFFNLGADDTIITIPTGVTQIQIFAGSNNTDGHSMWLERDSGGGFSTENILPQVGNSTSGNDFFALSCGTGLIDVTAGDEFRVVVRNTDAGTIGVLYTYFGIKVTQTNQVLTFPGVTVYRPNIGALVNKTDSNQSVTGGAQTTVSFSNTVYDTGFKGTNLFVNVSDHFLIPAGVTKIRLNGSVHVDDVANTFLTFRNGGAEFPGSSALDTSDTSGTEFVSIASPVVEVAEGDTLTLTVLMDTTNDVELNANQTTFSIEIIETTDDAFPPEEVSIFLNGVPAVDDLVYLKVSPRRFSFADEMLNSEAYADTAPSGAAIDFDVEKNGVSVGTISFADGVKTATFVTSGGSQVDFDPGDRLTIIAPADLQSAADISITLACFRT